AYRPEDVTVQLVRDTANLYDNNAVRIDISVKGSEVYNLGYIPRNLAYVVSAVLDKGIKLTAVFKEVRGRYARYMNYGAVITLQLA
ncbi:MAG: HIRAN domain-containing protein, partial [Candidatus Ornithomonoglobus sp.]